LLFSSTTHPRNHVLDHPGTTPVAALFVLNFEFQGAPMMKKGKPERGLKHHLAALTDKGISC
jgi:hypothetical protein